MPKEAAACNCLASCCAGPLCSECRPPRTLISAAHASGFTIGELPLGCCCCNHGFLLPSLSLPSNFFMLKANLVLSKSTSLLGNACCYLEGWIRQHPVFSSRRGWGEAPVWILPSKVEIQPLAATLEDEG